MKRLALALSFLTVIPMRITGTFQPGDLGRSAAWFPLVGLLIGGLLAVARLGLAQIFPAPLAAILVVALWAVLTGFLHLDGLADCFDGMLASVPPERRLEIMKDPRLGTFGGVGLILHLAIKAAALAALPVSGPAAALALLLAPTTARWLILLLARQPMARQGGLGADFALGVTWRTYLYAALVPLGLLVLGGLRGLLAVAVAHLAAFGIARLARARLGGVTGDVLGLAVEISEAVVLLVFAVQLSGG